MSSEQGQRIQANCKVIWGDGDYDFDIETNDWVNWQCIVKINFGDAYEPLLTMTQLYNSKERAYSELDKMLDVWARQGWRGLPMTKKQKLDLSCGTNSQSRDAVEQFLNELKRREG